MWGRVVWNRQMSVLDVIARVPLPVLRATALGAAWLINRVPVTGLRWMVRVNLMLAYPQMPAEQRLPLERCIVRNQCLSIVESVKSWGMPPAWSVAQITEVIGEEHLLEALHNPRGMLAIVPHLGTWEMMNAWLNQYGSPTIMYKPGKKGLANDFMLQGRQRLHATLVPTDASGVKAIFKTLKQGGFSIILPDHVPHEQGGVFAPFFGIETFSGTLVSKLASKTHCALVGLTCVRREDGQGFSVHCVRLDDPALYDTDTRTATAALNRELERMIDPVTEHYMWGYRRFKKSIGLSQIYNQSEPIIRRVRAMLDVPPIG